MSSEQVVERIPGAADSGLILLCDHAANALPPEYGTLVLPPGELDRHIAYDIGTAGVVRTLARALGVPAVLGRYSRLLIDLNRGEDDPTLIMSLSDGAIVPGNLALSAQERERRIALYHRPYHEAIAATVDEALAAGRPPVILSVHSFTPVWRGTERPWQLSVLWDKDPRFAMPLLARLRDEQDLVSGENEPYSGGLKNDTLYKHGTSRGLPHALLEFRQDMIAEGATQRKWGGRLAEIVQGIMMDERVAAECAAIRFAGSWTDVSQSRASNGAKGL